MNAEFSLEEYQFLFAPVIAIVFTLITQRALVNSSLAGNTLDYPNHRSLHERPTPRTGGIAMALGIACAWLLLPATPWLAALGGSALVLALISLIDDMRGLSAKMRLTAHFAVCMAFLAALGIEWSWILILLLPMVWAVNLYNFMDGLDGLAAGMTILGFGAYALLAALHGGTAVAVLSLCIAAAALGFLPFNFTPAKAFLGDAGSIPLGFLACAIGISGWHDGLWQLWFPVLVFSPFVVDATLTLILRAARGARLTEAHREHYYQRVAQMGFGHRNTALLEYTLMLLSGAGAVIIATGEGATPAITVVGLVALEIVCLIAVDRGWRQNRMANGQYRQHGPRR